MRVRRGADVRRPAMVPASPPTFNGEDFQRIMTTQTAEAPATTGLTRWLVVNAQSLISYGGLVFILLAGFAGAFRHMHDWSARYELRDWMCWANAITSELLPAISFFSWRDREEREKPSGLPLCTFVVSFAVSLCAQLSSTGVKLPYERQFLAVLPMAAAFVVLKIVVTDLKFAKETRLDAEAETARRAELARKQAARDAELAAELARNFEREQAELAAETSRREAELAAELAREQAERDAVERLRLAEIEQAAITRREELAAQERLELRQAAAVRERREAESRAAAELEAARIRAEAEAEVRRAEAERIRAEAAAKEQAAALVAGRHRVDAGHGGGAGGATVSPIRQRRSRVETQALVDATLAVLPAGTSRDDAVKVVARAIGNTERYAREFVPSDWTAVSSAGGESEAA